MINFSQKYLEKTIEHWQPFYQEQLNLDDAIEIATNTVSFLEVVMKWLEDDGIQKQGSKLDYCPTCEGSGVIPVKVKRNIYGYESTYDEGFACPNCLTGRDKKERPVYRFINSCCKEYTKEIGKQKKGVKT